MYRQRDGAVIRTRIQLPEDHLEALERLADVGRFRSGTKDLSSQLDRYLANVEVVARGSARG